MPDNQDQHQSSELQIVALGQTQQNRNYYEILGISKEASLGDIRKAYYKLAMQWHPDKNPNNSTAAEKFKVIAQAYETLSNDVGRLLYDAERLENEIDQADAVDNILKIEEWWREEVTISNLLARNDEGAKKIKEVFAKALLSQIESQAEEKGKLKAAWTLLKIPNQRNFLTRLQIIHVFIGREKNANFFDLLGKSTSIKNVFSGALTSIGIANLNVETVISLLNSSYVRTENNKINILSATEIALLIALHSSSGRPESEFLEKIFPPGEIKKNKDFLERLIADKNAFQELQKSAEFVDFAVKQTIEQPESAPDNKDQTNSTLEELDPDKLAEEVKVEKSLNDLWQKVWEKAMDPPSSSISPSKPETVNNQNKSVKETLLNFFTTIYHIVGISIGLNSKPLLEKMSSVIAASVASIKEGLSNLTQKKETETSKTPEVINLPASADPQPAVESTATPPPKPPRPVRPKAVTTDVQQSARDPQQSVQKGKSPNSPQKPQTPLVASLSASADLQQSEQKKRPKNNPQLKSSNENLLNNLKLVAHFVTTGRKYPQIVTDWLIKNSPYFNSIVEQFSKEFVNVFKDPKEIDGFFNLLDRFDPKKVSEFLEKHPHIEKYLAGNISKLIPVAKKWNSLLERVRKNQQLSPADKEKIEKEEEQMRKNQKKFINKSLDFDKGLLKSQPASNRSSIAPFLETNVSLLLDHINEKTLEGEPNLKTSKVIEDLPAPKQEVLQPVEQTSSASTQQPKPQPPEEQPEVGINTTKQASLIPSVHLNTPDKKEDKNSAKALIASWKALPQDTPHKIEAFFKQGLDLNAKANPVFRNLFVLKFALSNPQAAGLFLSDSYKKKAEDIFTPKQIEKLEEVANQTPTMKIPVPVLEKTAATSKPELTIVDPDNLNVGQRGIHQHKVKNTQEDDAFKFTDKVGELINVDPSKYSAEERIHLKEIKAALPRIKRYISDMKMSAPTTAELLKGCLLHHYNALGALSQSPKFSVTFFATKNTKPQGLLKSEIATCLEGVVDVNSSASSDKLNRIKLVSKYAEYEKQIEPTRGVAMSASA
jgi:curved DNA-binding protein CbpA